MYKNIVPGLISLDTQLNNLFGFTFSGRFDFYPLIKTSNKFHYKIEIDDHIHLPDAYDFRNGYISNQKNCLFYNWQLSSNFYLRFKFNILTNTFSFNRLYNYIPFELGRILPIGRHIADLICLHLFVKGYIPFKGAALKIKDKTICIVAPSYNGKSSILKNNLQLNNKYIAENNLILDIKNKIVYPTSSDPHNKNLLLKILFDSGRYKEKSVNYYLNQDNIIRTFQKIDKLILLINNTNKSVFSSGYSLLDFFLICSPNFFDNILVKSVIFRYKSLNQIIKQFDNIAKSNLDYQFKHIYNFNYEKLFR